MFYIPTRGPEDWQQLLAEPEKHWKTGYSARALAHCWEAARGFPPEVDAVLRSEMVFSDIEALLCIPEHQVALPGGKAASQNDLWVLAKCATGLVSIAVEGKVEEPFGETVGEWLRDASPGKRERLQFLASCLALGSKVPDDIRYQLLHRTASAVMEARRFNALYAVMLVHSFSRGRARFEDYEEYARLFRVEAVPDRITPVTNLSGVRLFIGWIGGDARWLAA